MAKLPKDDRSVPLIEIRCYLCRERLPLEQVPNAGWYSINHTCMSEAAKAVRFPETDGELRRLREKVNEQYVDLQRLGVEVDRLCAQVANSVAPPRSDPSGSLYSPRSSRARRCSAALKA